MAVISFAFLRDAEGQQVTVVLKDGTRFEGCCLVSVGRLWARSLWLINDETDLIICRDEIADIFVLDGQRAA